MKARRKDNGQWVDVYYDGYIEYEETNIYKEYNTNITHKEKDLVFEDKEILDSYWFNFRNQAAMTAMQISIPNVIKADDVSFEKSVAQMAVKIADALVEELQKKTD